MPFAPDLQISSVPADAACTPTTRIPNAATATTTARRRNPPFLICCTIPPFKAQHHAGCCPSAFGARRVASHPGPRGPPYRDQRRSVEPSPQNHSPQPDGGILRLAPHPWYPPRWVIVPHREG